MSLIETLIDKQDTFERIRDKIIQILLFEVDGQMALAEAANKDPKLWKLRVFSERSNSIETWLNDTDNKIPIVNVWFDSENVVLGGSNLIERQRYDGVFNLDCYGFGVSTGTVSGHNPGDKEAVYEVHRAVRLVRNIIMAGVGNYRYLDLRGLVGDRVIESVQRFPMELDVDTVHNVVGARMRLKVSYNELSPQIVPQILEQVNVDVQQNEQGENFIQLQYNYP